MRSIDGRSIMSRVKREGRRGVEGGTPRVPVARGWKNAVVPFVFRSFLVRYADNRGTERPRLSRVYFAIEILSSRSGLSAFHPPNDKRRV